MHSVTIVWFKRDLRLDDHAPLLNAIYSGRNIILLWIYDDFMRQSNLHSERHLRFQLESIYNLKGNFSLQFRFKFC